MKNERSNLMAWKHRLTNAGEGALSGASTGGGIGAFFGIKGAAIGAGVGGGIGALLGLLSDTDQQELAEAWARGELDPETQDYLTELVSDRFKNIRTQQNARLDRSGIGKSSIAERIRSDTDASERDTLAKAFTDQIFARQQLGLGMQAQRQDQTRRTVAGSVDNLMSVLSGFQADKRYENEQAATSKFRSEFMKLIGGDSGETDTTKLTPNQAKAAATVGMMPRGTGRGASGSSWGHLSHGNRPQSKMGMLNSRQGGGSYDARSANPWFSGSRNRKSVI